MASRLSLEGPISDSSRGSFLISGRRTYIDPILNLAAKSPNSDNNFAYYFYDLNVKANYQFSPEDKVYLSGYFGRDNISFKDTPLTDEPKVRLDLLWGNAAYNLRYHRIWSSRLFTNAALIYSDYRSKFLFDWKQNVNKKPSVSDWIASLDADYYMSESSVLQFGASYLHHAFSAFSGIQDIKNTVPVFLASSEIQGYLSLDVTLNETFRTTAGVQSAYFESGNYFVFDPRFNVRVQLSDKNSINASYTRMHQFVHLLSSASLSNPGDILYPSTEFLKPEFSDQLSVGLETLFDGGALGEGRYELDADVYYKNMKNLPLFKQSFSSADPANLAQDVTLGVGWAYGFELSFQYSNAGTSSFVNYTISKAWRKYADKNAGEPFPAKFDRTHQINVFIDHRLSERWAAAWASVAPV